MINFFIDLLWEGMVMLLKMLLGKCGNLLEVNGENVWLLKVELFVLNELELKEIWDLEFVMEIFFILFVVVDGLEGL